MVERESRVDDADRTEVLALLQHDAELSACGYHPVIANDPENFFTPETGVCPVCAAMDVHHRVLAEKDKGVPQDAPPLTPRASDGRYSYMRRLTPEQASAMQTKSVPQG